MSAFLIYILKVAMLTAAFVLLYHVLFRRDTFFGAARTVLVSSLVIAYILPFCVITIHKPVMVADSIEELSEPFPEVLATIPYSNQEQPVVQQAQNQIQAHQPAAMLPETKHRHIDWTLIAIVIYAAGVLSLIIIRLMSVRKVTGIIRRGRVVMEKDGCKEIVSNDNIRPFSWMRYIVLPESHANLSWTSPVIRHEYSHISHHHSAELLATDILSAFQWFNPAVWLLRHDLCCVQEFQADASVLESGLDKTEYGQSLLNLATGGMSVPFVNGLSESNLRARIRMMNRKLSHKANLLKLIYLPVVILVSLSLMANTVYDDNKTYWDNYTDATPGIKSIEVNDRDVQGSTTIYNENGMQQERLNWICQTNEAGANIIGNNGSEHYNYDEKGRLVSRRTSTDGVVVINIEYGNHGKYVPVSMGEPYRGDIMTLMDTRLIKDVSAISMEYSDGSVIRHVFVPDGNRLIHKYPDMTNGQDTVEKQQIIECNERGLPYYIETENGHIGPVSYQSDGGFDSIIELHGKTGETQWTIIYKYAPGTHYTSEIIRISDDMTTRTLYSHNDKGDLLNSRMDVEHRDNQPKQDFSYEYDSHGNWVKRKRDIYAYAGATPISEVMTRSIKYYDSDISKEEYQRLLSQSYLLTPDTLLTREQLSLQLKLGNFMNTYVTVENNHMKLSVPRIVLTSMGIPSFYYDILQYQIDENNAFFDNMFEEGEIFDTEKMLQEANGRYWNEERPQLVSRIERYDSSERQKSIEYIQNNWQITSPGETTQQTKNDSIITYIDVDVKNGDAKSLVEREQFKEATDRFSSKLSYNEDGTVSLSDNTTSQDIQISPELFEMFNEVIDIYNNGVKETDSVMALDGTDANRENLSDPANSIDELFENDGIVTNNKAYKGYLNFIRISNSVYEFWIVGVADKGGKAVTIELGSINYAITFLENLISSYKQGSTIEIKGHSFTGVKGKAYSIPRSDGFDSEPYLVSIKHLKHDLSVLEKRRDRPNVGYDEVGFFTEENKPDHYEVLFPGWPRLFESLHMNTWDGVDGGEEWAATELEKQIRERGSEGHVPGRSELAVTKFNGVILLPLHKSEYMTPSGAYKEYIQYYIPIIYDPEKYQAPLTDYQKSLKRSVFKRNK